MLFFFFFQAEDGIRDIGVTGVQTCALPICSLDAAVAWSWQLLSPEERVLVRRLAVFPEAITAAAAAAVCADRGIGRAAGRGRVEISGGGVSFKKKKNKQ